MKPDKRRLQKSLIQNKIIVLIFFVYLLRSCNTANENFIFPEKEFPLLFIDVQRNKVFNDDKTFPDCTPKHTSWVINYKYRVWKVFHRKSDLKKFVVSNFELPTLYIDSISAKNDILSHIKYVSAGLLINKDQQSNHSSLIPLPNDFVIPGGRFRETYYWDTYFTLLGYAGLNQKEIVFQMTENLAYLIRKFGFIPNGNRSYYLSRSQPPFFSLIVELNAALFADSMYIHFLPELEKEYRFWMSPNLPDTIYRRSVKLNDSTFLNRYYDSLNQPRVEMYNEDINSFNSLKNLITDTNNFYRNIRSTAESGWDFSSRWYTLSSGFAGLETLDILPVDLNCLLYHLEKTISKAYSLKNNNKASFYEQLAKERKEYINIFFWNNSDGFYFDYNFRKRKITGKYTLAGVFPLFMGLSDSMQAIKVSNTIRNQFLKQGGVVTSLTNSGQQWDYPNGWAPLQWITIQSLRKYHIDGLADTIKIRWLYTNELFFNKKHKMLEKYNVVDTTSVSGNGEYPTQDGFGWTNGVYIDLRRNFNTLSSSGE